MTNYAPHEHDPGFLNPDAMQKFLTRMGVQVSQGAELMRKVRMAGQYYDAIMLARMREGRLSPPRLRLLLCLFAQEANGNESLSPTELSRYLTLSKNTISGHLRALEEAGLLAREVDPDDLRQFRIRLADAGRRFLLESAPDHMALMDSLVQELSGAEMAQLQELLGKLLQSLYIHGLADGGLRCGKHADE